MSDHRDDPYECHARYYLKKLQQEAQEFSGGVANVDIPIQRLERTWPQVLAAFAWASGARSSSQAAAEICDALLASANGDIAQLQSRRRSDDVRKFADSLSLTARHQERANDAAFLYRFAGIALTQARILELAEQTGAEVHAVLGGLLKAIKEKQAEGAK